MRFATLIPVLFFLAACNGNPEKEYSPGDSTTVKPTPASADKPTQPSREAKESTQLLGIWGKSEDENASFQILKDSIYYPEHDAYYHYKITGDSIRIKYDDYEGSFNFRFKGNDTLILNGMYGEQTYIRRK